MSSWLTSLKAELQEWLELGPPMFDGGARHHRSAAQLERMRAASVLKPGEIIWTDGPNAQFSAEMVRQQSWLMWFNAANKKTARLRCHSIRYKA